MWECVHGVGVAVHNRARFCQVTADVTHDFHCVEHDRKLIVSVFHKVLQSGPTWSIKTSLDTASQKTLNAPTVVRGGKAPPGAGVATIMARYAVCSAATSFRRWHLRRRSAWMDGAQGRIMAWTCSTTDNMFVTVTPCIFMVVTRSTPASGGSSAGRRRRGSTKTISVHLWRFSRRVYWLLDMAELGGVRDGTTAQSNPIFIVTRKLCYRKDDRAMRAI